MHYYGRMDECSILRKKAFSQFVLHLVSVSPRRMMRLAVFTTGLILYHLLLLGLSSCWTWFWEFWAGEYLRKLHFRRILALSVLQCFLIPPYNARKRCTWELDQSLSHMRYICAANIASTVRCVDIGAVSWMTESEKVMEIHWTGGQAAVLNGEKNNHLQNIWLEEKCQRSWKFISRPWWLMV